VLIFFFFNAQLHLVSGSGLSWTCQPETSRCKLNWNGRESIRFQFLYNFNNFNILDMSFTYFIIIIFKKIIKVI
jgi:hypothetical protein